MKKHKQPKIESKSKVKLKKTPDHHDAELALKLYDLRRESVMRQSRDAIAKFTPRSYEEFIEITKPEHPHNAAWRQVSSYFEMAFGFARHGIVNPDFLAENCGEGFLLFAKVAPHLERFRKEAGAPNAFRNAEWMVANSASAKQRFELFTARFAKQAAAAK
ncbi:MAG: hypothetical protein IT454_16665 [Planctomycetes bacterium]|nr:hypothetical protein [Planctomycetota bacterium]